MKFSTEPELWRGTLVEPNDQVCKEAIDWIEKFEAYGGTCTIDALRVRFLLHNTDNCSYLYLAWLNSFFF